MVEEVEWILSVPHHTDNPDFVFFRGHGKLLVAWLCGKGI